MPIDAIYSFLTYPKSNEKAQARVEGVYIKPDEGKLSSMLRSVFDDAGRKLDIPIMFVADDQANPARDELIIFFEAPSLDTATPLAARLQRATMGTSGMGLFFVCLGSDQETLGKRTVLSRFAADEGVVASQDGQGLSVQFVEQVFLKSAYSYKAATFRYAGKKDDAWKGYAIDRQINNGSKSVADYWIINFLGSELATTAAQGTKRLAIAMRDAIKLSSDVSIRSEIVAAAKLAGNLPRRAMSIEQVCKQFSLTEGATTAIKSAVKPSRLVGESFKFDAEEFAKHVSYKHIELDNGATLTAPMERFDEVFKTKARGNVYAYSTEGHIVDEKLKSRR